MYEYTHTYLLYQMPLFKKKNDFQCTADDSYGMESNLGKNNVKSKDNARKR